MARPRLRDTKMTLWLTVVPIAFAVGGLLIWLHERRCQSCLQVQVNHELQSLVCARCGGGFEHWRGQISNNHYLFVEPQIPTVLEVRCSQCGQLADLFCFADGRIEAAG